MRRIALTVLAALVLALASTQVAAQSCSVNGNDLTPLGTQTLDVMQSLGNGQTSPYSWQINFCTQQTIPAACQQNASPQAYVNQMDKSSNACFQQFVTFLNNNWQQRYGGWFNAISTKDGNMFNVTLICDESTTTLAAVGSFYAHQSNGAGPYTWDARIKTKYACGASTPTPGGPPAPGSNSTTGAPNGPGDKKDEGEKASAGAIVFVVLVFVLPVVYVVGFVLYNKFKLGKAGLDLLPHPEFWKDFPVLCLDGCKFVKNKFLQCIGKGDGTGEYGGGTEGSYSQVA